MTTIKGHEIKRLAGLCNQLYAAANMELESGVAPNEDYLPLHAQKGAALLANEQLLDLWSAHLGDYAMSLVLCLQRWNTSLTLDRIIRDTSPMVGSKWKAQGRIVVLERMIIEVENLLRAHGIPLPQNSAL